MNVLLSIKPEYVEKILSGEKRYEFRKRIWKKEVDRVFIYSTSPVKRIVASFKPGTIIEGSPDELWKRYGRASGVSEREFNDYFRNIASGHAIEIIDPTRLKEIANLSKISKDFAAPQSFYYFHENIIQEREVSFDG